MGFARLRLGLFSFNSCEGCKHVILASWEEFRSELLAMGIEVVREPILGLEHEGDLDIAIVEGGIEKDRVGELESVRSRSRYLIAVGTCVASAYPPMARGGTELVPVDSVVRVDAWVRGCPVDLGELVRAISWIAKGLPPRVARFDWVSRRYVVVPGKLMELRGDKCIVCGRCIEACRAVGLSILNYAFRGIDTVVTTPFSEPFEAHGCVNCGACMYVCPVGAIVPRVGFELGRELWIDVEALAIVSAYLKLDTGRTITVLRALGPSRIVVWSPASNHRGKGRVLIPSPAEEEALKRYAPHLLKEIANELEPPPATLATPCISWAARTRSMALATQLAKLAKSVARDYGEYVDPSEPDELVVDETYLRAKHLRIPVHKLRNLSPTSTVAIYICPYRCSTPALQLGLDPRQVDGVRDRMLAELVGYARK